MRMSKMTEQTRFLDVLRQAWPKTLPVLTGYAFLGIAYGVLMQTNGYGAGWTLLFSVFTFAGSAQYMAITFLTTAFDPLAAFLLTLMINARHIFYGISMLGKYNSVKRFKPYLIFGLTDETFAVVQTHEPDPSIDRATYYFVITLLDHLYWVLGSLIGSMLGQAIHVEVRGLEFVLTALFVVIFVSQWQSQRNHRPAIIGLIVSILGLVFFGPDGFVIPAMVLMLVVLFAGRKRIDEVQTR